MSFITDVEAFADYASKGRPDLARVTVGVTEPYARKRLGLKKDEPLAFKGYALNCIGSKRWRERQAALKRFRDQFTRKDALTESQAVQP